VRGLNTLAATIWDAAGRVGDCWHQLRGGTCMGWGKPPFALPGITAAHGRQTTRAAVVCKTAPTGWGTPAPG